MAGKLREARSLEVLRDQFLADLGWKAPAMSAISKDANGDIVLYLNYTDSTPSTNDVACFVRLKGVDSAFPDSFRTASNASGQFIDSSFQAELIAEGAANFSGTHFRFLQDVQHCLRGLMGCPVTLKLAANGSVPEINGINGETADANIVAGIFLPVIGRGYVGGI